MMINDQDKLCLINLKLDFWRERLQENNNAVLSLNDLGNQSKIEGTVLDIDRYTKIIQALEAEKEALTNQG
jgi:hypothetical protein